MHYAFNESYTGTTREEILNYYMSKPAGITNQKYFVSEKAWENGYTAATGTFAFKDGPAKRVRDVVLNVGNIHEEVDINIFFDFK